MLGSVAVIHHRATGNSDATSAADVLRATRDLALQAPDELNMQCVIGRRTAEAAVPGR